jgi:cytochrome c-type biogenesis protein CcmH
MKRLLLACLLSLGLSAVAQAAIDTYTFKSDAERERFRALTEELRCPKCQNQNLADSNAPIAMDLRHEIFRMMEAGKGDDEIVDYLVLRYGEFVRYKPRVSGGTLLLWFGPAAALVGGFVLLAVIVLRRRRNENAPNLSDDERARLDSLLTRTQPPVDNDRR